MKKSVLGLFFILTIGSISFLLSSCGDDAASTSVLTRAMGLVAVTSPTATTSRSRGNVLFTDDQNNPKPMNEMIQDMRNLQAAADPTTSAAGLGNPIAPITSTNAECYGPNLTDNAKGSDIARPPGDLGLFYDTASDTDVIACAAAEFNALMAGSPQYVNKWVGAQAVMLAVLGQAGNALPAVGASLDAIASMPAIEGISLTTATLERLADDADGNETYKTFIAFTKEGEATAGSVTIYHTPRNNDNTSFRGLFQAILPHESSQGRVPVQGYRGISMAYAQTDGSLTFSLKIGANRSTASDDFFGTDGVVDFTKAAFGEDGHYLNATFNTTTNAARAHYAWQAGGSDGAIRTFSVDVPIGTEGASGSAYFGFGADIDTIEGVGAPWMTKMFCNWVEGTSMGVSQAKVQKQLFDLTSFAPTTSLIDFAPNDQCQCDSAGGVCNNTFTVAASAQTPDFLEGVHTVATHELVNPPTAADIPVVTEPTFAIPAR